MSKRLSLAAIALWTAQASAAPSTPANALQAILADYDSYEKTTDPISAGQRGDLAAAARWPDDRPAAIAHRHAQLAAPQARLRAIPASALAGEAAPNHALLACHIDSDLEGEKFHEARIPFTSDERFFVTPLYAADALCCSLSGQDSVEEIAKPSEGGNLFWEDIVFKSFHAGGE